MKRAEACRAWAGGRNGELRGYREPPPSEHTASPILRLVLLENIKAEIKGRRVGARCRWDGPKIIQVHAYRLKACAFRVHL